MLMRTVIHDDDMISDTFEESAGAVCNRNDI